MSRERGSVETLIARGENQILHEEYSSALATYQQVRAEATSTGGNPEVETQALLGLARCQIGLRHYDEALKTLYRVRSRRPGGATEVAIERAIGEALFQKGDYRKAHNHLVPVLGKVEGRERDEVLLQLSICARHGRNLRLAEKYRRAIQDPSAPELERTRARHEPRPAEKKYHLTAARPRQPRTVTPRAESHRHRAPPSYRAGSVTVIPRSRWNARPTRRNAAPMGRPTKITVHHTGGPTLFWSESFRATADEIYAIQKVHQKQRGWADLGYHFVIDRSGRVWEGRPLRFQGAHAGNPSTNRGNIGVVLLGNFIHQDIPPQQAQALYGFLASYTDRYKIPPHRIYTHSEIRHGSTTCPGPRVSHLVESFRRRGLAAAP